MFTDNKIPIGVMLLYKHNIKSFESTLSHTNVKEFIINPLLNQQKAEFKLDGPLKQIGVPRETRTPTKGFGDPRAAITPARHELVDAVGLEPTMPEAEDLQSPGVTNFPTHP